MAPPDLTPFGFTPTESLAYSTLLRLGPATGYAVAGAAHLARANTYSALEGLVHRGAATRTDARPVRYRPTDPQALVAQLATVQGEALDRLTRELRNLSHPRTPATREVAGSRAVVNLIQQLVARAETRVGGSIPGDLWRRPFPPGAPPGGRARGTPKTSGGELPAAPPRRPPPPGPARPA